MLSTLRSFLSIPEAYNLFQKAIGAQSSCATLVKEYIRPREGDRILEIGCGPGTVVPFLPRCDYVGFDMSAEYIEHAKQAFPQATFVCERVSGYTLPQTSAFDIVLALGILHHLDDDEAEQLFRVAVQALRPGGRLVTYDGVYTNDQAKAARFMLSRDRGQFVRHEHEYVRLANRVFAPKKVRATLRHDLLRIPYSHLVLECER